MDKVQEMKIALWKRYGIYELIQLIRTQLETNLPLLPAANFFWSSSFNAFVFPFSTFIITLYNLAVLFVLNSQGAEPDANFEMDTSNFNYLFPNATEFVSFLDVYAKKAKIRDVDPMAFLLYWLYCHVAYYQFKKVIKA